MSRKVEHRHLSSTCTVGAEEWPMPGCYGSSLLLWEKCVAAPGVWFLTAIRPAPKGAR